MELTQQQKHCFETFGYLTFPGLLAEEIGWILDEFEAVFQDRKVQHDGTQRSCVVPFIDQRERLCTLLDHPKLKAIAAGILGDDFNYLGGDGNYYTGDTNWHSDGWHTVGKFLKVALYLDPVKRDTGCLRVIPGTHRTEIVDKWDARRAANAQQLWGIAGREVPAVALESQPGDVVAFNHNLMHASFGGSTRRRMFTLNLCRHCETADEIQDLEDYINSHARFWLDHLHSDVMRNTASPERMQHLEQVMAHESQLAELSAKARGEMTEAARG
ncbi:MAG: phytanoyl-CoA dioxygenase family protein [Abitibacteriaceae bacterium]|nr:phytanoyl-CoA dioxygenase family protein [Abditibacteriaceae bacterium]MBV9865996.1 phytanoyl-CoA dioxygenase family protein [Abditibacteriaceae bacterium]